MAHSTYYDLSRLALRLGRPVPSGIDRLDLLWARAAFSSDTNTAGIVTGVLGQRVVPKATALAILKLAGERWDTSAPGAPDPVFDDIRAWLLGHGIAQPPRPASGARDTASTAFKLFRSVSLGRDGIFPGRSPRIALPRGATYVNISQFPLALPRITQWLDRRPDLDSVVMIHDMLPLSHPEFFPPGEYRQHVRLIERAAKVARILVVTGDVVKRALASYIADRGLRLPNIAVVPPPLDPIFHEPATIDTDLRRHPYFIVCGTIEPRKNHLFLLHVWRELAAELGPATPKLVIVGARGWDCENVVDLLERSPTVRPYVREVAGLGTRALKKLMDNSRAMLMPTFAEGYGLPVAEALAAGVPVLTTAVPALLPHAEHDCISVLDPIDGAAWRTAIKKAAIGPFSTGRTQAICSTLNNPCPTQHISKFIFDRPWTDHETACTRNE